jgi:hypothetical protein
MIDGMVARPRSKDQGSGLDRPAASCNKHLPPGFCLFVLPLIIRCPIYTLGKDLSWWCTCRWIKSMAINFPHKYHYFMHDIYSAVTHLSWPHCSQTGWNISPYHIYGNIPARSALCTYATLKFHANQQWVDLQVDSDPGPRWLPSLPG